MLEIESDRWPGPESYEESSHCGTEWPRTVTWCICGYTCSSRGAFTYLLSMEISGSCYPWNARRVCTVDEHVYPQSLGTFHLLSEGGGGSKYPKIHKFFIDPRILCLKIPQTPLPPLWIFRRPPYLLNNTRFFVDPLSRGLWEKFNLTLKGPNQPIS